jgi:hypothetical protein
MKQMFALYSLGLWGLLVLVAIINGALREGLLTPNLGDTLGRALSAVILSAAILLVAYLFLSRTSIEYTASDLWMVGAMWLVLTVVFEFGFGHFVMGHSWEFLMEDYNILKGRIWAVVLIVSAVGPYLMGSFVDNRWL